MCRHEAGLSSSFITQTYSNTRGFLPAQTRNHKQLREKQKIPTWLIYQVHIRFLQSKRDLIKLDYLANREFYNESVSKCEENKKISSV